MPELDEQLDFSGAVELASNIGSAIKHSRAPLPGRATHDLVCIIIDLLAKENAVQAGLRDGLRRVVIDAGVEDERRGLTLADPKPDVEYDAWQVGEVIEHVGGFLENYLDRDGLGLRTAIMAMLHTYVAEHLVSRDTLQELVRRYCS